MDFFRLARARAVAVGLLLLTFALISVLATPIASASNVAQTTSGAIAGRVIDTAGNGIAGAQLSANGQTLGASDAAGNFTITGLQPTSRLAVTASAGGFVPSTRIFIVVSGQTVRNTITLLRRVSPVAFSADTGATLSISGAGSGTLRIPGGALVRPGGAPATGTAFAQLTFLNVTRTEQLRSAPGDFTATQLDGSSVSLETSGMFEFLITDAAGNRLDLAPGKQAALSFAPSDLPFVGTSMGLYEFNTASGLWIERGPIRLEGSGATTSKRARFQSTTGRWNGWLPTLRPTWNIDKPFQRGLLRIVVVSQAGVRLPNRAVEAQGVTYNGLSTGYTNDRGEACVWVQTGSTVLARAVFGGPPVSVNIPTATPTSCFDPIVPVVTVIGN